MKRQARQQRLERRHASHPNDPILTKKPTFHLGYQRRMSWSCSWTASISDQPSAAIQFQFSEQHDEKHAQKQKRDPKRSNEGSARHEWCWLYQVFWRAQGEDNPRNTRKRNRKRGKREAYEELAENETEQSWGGKKRKAKREAEQSNQKWFNHHTVRLSSVSCQNI